jgi:hypothetical protein
LVLLVSEIFGDFLEGLVLRFWNDEPDEGDGGQAHARVEQEDAAEAERGCNGWVSEVRDRYYDFL